MCACLILEFTCLQLKFLCNPIRYGLSAGKPSPAAVYADAEAVYDHYVTEYGHLSHLPIICYGQSLGSGPSLHLASTPKLKVDGLIVHSGLISALKVIKPDTSNT